MGIAAGLATALLSAGVNHFFNSPAHEAPVPVYAEQLDGLTRKGRLIVEHSGARDPKDEGFISGYALAMPEQQAHWSALKMMPSLNPASWRIYNPVLGAVPFRYPLKPDDVNQARGKGWRITLQSRMLKLTDASGGMHANFNTGVRRYDLNIVRAFPRLLETNKALVLRLNTRILTAVAATGREAGNEDPIDGDRAHQFVMTYDPATSIAQVYVDEKLRLKDKYEGHSDYTGGGASFLFGTSGADSTFELVRFEIFQ